MPIFKTAQQAAAIALAATIVAFAGQGPSIYVMPDNGFETNIIAALEKKHVPVQIVTEKTQADYVLTATSVEIHKESAGGKIARCLFAYCAGIDDSGDVSVQMVDSHTNTVVWGYNVAKQRANKNRQSMAEAIAKHLKNDYLDK